MGTERPPVGLGSMPLVSGTLQTVEAVWSARTPRNTPLYYPALASLMHRTGLAVVGGALGDVFWRSTPCLGRGALAVPNRLVQCQ